MIRRSPSDSERAAESRRLDALALAARGGDRQAFTELVRRTIDEVRSFVAARNPGCVITDDVVQDTYLIAYQRLAAYEARGSLQPWLKGIARLRLCELLRVEAKQRGSVGDELGALLAAGARDRCQTAAMIADEERCLQREALADCLHRLAPRARMLIERRYLQDLPVNRLAQQFKASKDAITAQLRRIRLSLRDCLRGKDVHS